MCSSTQNMCSNTYCFVKISTVLYICENEKKYTIKDIAALAGVSKGTVDRVLHKRGKVSEEALAKVNRILEDIDYKPNVIARNLKNNKDYHIGVLLPNPDIDNYWKRCKEGILSASQVFMPFNVNVTIVTYDPRSTVSFKKKHQVLLKQNPDAVLLAPLFYKEAKKAISDYKKLNIPVLTFNNQVSPEIADGFVGQDLIQSGRVAAKLLHSMIKTGDITIIHINEDITNALHMQQKEKGFTTYFKELNTSLFKITTLQIEAKKLQTALPEYLNSHPNTKGLFITTSKSYLVAQTLETANFSDISLIGYDLLDLNIDYLKSEIITFLINQNPKQQTYLGITKLAEHLIYQNEIKKKTLLPIDIINSENFSLYIQ
ncbi:transcriptional regulator, LacI family [Formosa agariphila KMM 3901]|uniref:Transcriptional regulator, LacI family n=2 Tax=Formosa TaxID=225842 RepID=T2KPD5_FORAG|nr:transcriptional regulator, LacI family [Formosa agariphila KMM 3901]